MGTVLPGVRPGCGVDGDGVKSGCRGVEGLPGLGVPGLVAPGFVAPGLTVPGLVVPGLVAPGLAPGAVPTPPVPPAAWPKAESVSAPVHATTSMVRLAINVFI